MKSLGIPSCLWLMVYLLHFALSSRLPRGPEPKVSLFVRSPEKDLQNPTNGSEKLLRLIHKDNWTGYNWSNLARISKSIIRPTSDGKFVEEKMDGVMLRTEIGNNEIFVPEELISMTKKLLTKVPERLKNLRTSLGFGEKRPVKRHVTGTIMKGIPFSFQYIVDDELSQNFQTRQETKSPEGVVRGCYQVLEPEGLVRTVTYRADQNGFRVVDVSKGSDRIPCSGSDREDFQTPFQRALGQKSFGRTLSLNSGNRLPKRKQSLQKTLVSNKNQEAEVQTLKQPQRHIQKQLQRPIQRHRLSKTSKNKQKSFQTSTPINEVNRKNSDEVAIKSKKSGSSSSKGYEESVLDNLNNLSNTLLGSFRSNQKQNAPSNFINFPFVLIPISTFFQLKRDGHIDDSVQGFGAVIQKRNNEKQNLFSSSPALGVLPSLGHLFSTIDSLEVGTGKQLFNDPQFNLQPMLSHEKSFEFDKLDPSSSYSQIYPTIVSTDEPLQNFLNKNSQLDESDISLNDPQTSKPAHEEELEENSSYINYDKTNIEDHLFDSFEVDYFEENFNLGGKDNILELASNDYQNIELSSEQLKTPSTVNGFTVPSISGLPLQDSNENDFSLLLPPFPPGTDHIPIDQETSGSSLVPKIVSKPTNNDKDLWNTDKVDDASVDFTRPASFGQKIKPTISYGNPLDDVVDGKINDWNRKTSSNPTEIDTNKNSKLSTDDGSKISKSIDQDSFQTYGPPDQSNGLSVDDLQKHTIVQKNENLPYDKKSTMQEELKFLPSNVSSLNYRPFSDILRQRNKQIDSSEHKEKIFPGLSLYKSPQETASTKKISANNLKQNHRTTESTNKKIFHQNQSPNIKTTFSQKPFDSKSIISKHIKRNLSTSEGPRITQLFPSLQKTQLPQELPTSQYPSRTKQKTLSKPKNKLQPILPAQNQRRTRVSRRKINYLAKTEENSLLNEKEAATLSSSNQAKRLSSVGNKPILESSVSNIRRGKIAPGLRRIPHRTVIRKVRIQGKSKLPLEQTRNQHKTQILSNKSRIQNINMENQRNIIQSNNHSPIQRPSTNDYSAPKPRIPRRSELPSNRNSKMLTPPIVDNSNQWTPLINY